jgi:isoleucyl-tRNA synthetase
MFREALAQASLVGIEEQVQRFWRRTGLSDALRDGPDLPAGPAGGAGGPFLLCPQPLIPVGQSWADQVRLLATADLFARYRAKRGDVVHHRLGWSCHGLPVEVAVERSLGPAVADYDLARFNAACREAVAQGLQDAEELALRLGVWLDPAHSYNTLAPQASSAVWSVLKQMWEEGRLRYERQVVPVCPRCATPLSTAEAQRTTTPVEGHSIWIRLPLANARDRRLSSETNTYLLAWTPDPWMIVGMVALAAHPSQSYALVETATADEPPVRLLLAESTLDRILPSAATGGLPAGYRLVHRMRGKALRQASYRPPFTFLPAGEGMNHVVLSDEVAPDQGSGLLPVVPAFDAFSLSLALAHDLPLPELLDDWGNLCTTVADWQGLSPFEAEPFIIEDLLTRGLVFKQASTARLRSLCPHCQMPLLPLVRPVWQISAEPGSWTVGRDRAWGLPMPIWICEACGAQACLATLEELAHRTGLAVEEIDPHRPAVDRLAFSCERCGSMMRRTPAVVDAAFEVAAASLCTLPQAGPGVDAEVSPGRPAAAPGFGLAVSLGRTHSGWLADLAALAGLVHRAPAWTQAVELPEHIQPPAPRVAEGMDLDRMHSSPATALRWAAYTGTTPDQAEETFLRPLWQLICESVDRTAERPSSPVGSEQILSEAAQQILVRWLHARLYQGIATITDALESFQPETAAARLAALIGDLQQWPATYVEAGTTTVLEALSCLLAPFTPHLAEAIYQQVGPAPTEAASSQDGSEDRPFARSVHRAGWPVAEPAWADPELLGHMAHVRSLSQLGRSARSEAAIAPERQLRLAVVGRLGGQGTELARLLPYEELLRQQLGVERVEIWADAASLVDWHLAARPDRAVEHGLEPEQVDRALAALPADAAGELAAQLLNGSGVSLEVTGRSVKLVADQLWISARPRPGWAAAAGAGCLVLLAVDPGPTALPLQDDRVG